MKPTHPDRWITAGAVVVPAGAALALIPLRDALVSTNVALLLVITVVAFAATGRRPAAVLAAISAAVGFNVFHTEPYLSVRISSSDDLETAALLLIVGLAVGEIALRGRRARAVAAQEREDLASIHGLGALVANGEDSDYVLLATSSELTHLLGLVDCRFESAPSDDTIYPVVHRDGSVCWGPTAWDAARWGLPSDGAVIPVWSHGRRRGRFVITTPVALPVSAEQLAKAVALVDQAGASLDAQTGAA
jgi:K+-sensing histidine kinase KdpD